MMKSDRTTLTGHSTTRAAAGAQARGVLINIRVRLGQIVNAPRRWRCPNESAAMGPIAIQKSPGARTIWSPRSRERHGRELTSIQTHPRHVYYNPDLHSLSSEPMFDVGLITHISCRHYRHHSAVHRSLDGAISGKRGPFNRSQKSRSAHMHHCPVTMIDGFPPPTAGGEEEPGVQIGEPPPPPPPASGVQISPRVAATPSCPLAVVTRGPN
jgi:hypothetical protein